VTRKRRRLPIHAVIAERIFERADGREVRVAVGRPRRLNKDEWRCEFRILGVGHSRVYSLPGSDSLQALQMALAVMAAQVESYARERGLTFLGSSSLLVMKPDYQAMTREIKESPEFPLVADAIGDIWREMTGEPLRRD
jgi:hypothetical protein